MQEPDELDMCVAALLSLRMQLDSITNTYSKPHQKALISTACKAIDTVRRCLTELKETP